MASASQTTPIIRDCRLIKARKPPLSDQNLAKDAQGCFMYVMCTVCMRNVAENSSCSKRFHNLQMNSTTDEAGIEVKETKKAPEIFPVCDACMDAHNFEEGTTLISCDGVITRVNCIHRGND